MLAERIMIEDLDTAFTQWTQELIGATFERQLMDLAPVIYREFDSHFKNAQGPNGAWQKRTRQYRRYACPDRDVDGLLLLNGQFKRTYSGLLRLLGIAEIAIRQAQDSRHNQRDGCKLNCVHFVSFHR